MKILPILSTKLLLLSLLLSFNSYANRPAEDDDPAPQVVTPEANSNVPSPEVIAPEQVPVEEQEVTTDVQTGDVIQMPAPDTVVKLIDFPVRGMEMSKVLNELGEPTQRFPAIGNPPITRWVYSDRIVFFEYSHVIHVVAK